MPTTGDADLLLQLVAFFGGAARDDDVGLQLEHLLGIDAGFHQVVSVAGRGQGGELVGVHLGVGARGEAGVSISVMAISLSWAPAYTTKRAALPTVAHVSASAGTVTSRP